MPLITIDAGLCRKEGLCTMVCQKVFEQPDATSIPVVVSEESCNSCGHCVLVCPAGAISQTNCPPGAVHPVETDRLPTWEQVREMTRTRRSVRAFKKDGVEKELIERVIDAARFAPSAKNTQSTDFTVIQDRATLREVAMATAQWVGKSAGRLRNPLWRGLYRMAGERDAQEIKRWIGQFERTAEKARKGVDVILFDAPVLLLFHADKKVRFGEANANLALQNGTMAALSLGLGCFYTGYVITACSHLKSLREMLRLPAGHRLYGGLAIGYPRIRFTRWIDRNPPKVTWI